MADSPVVAKTDLLSCTIKVKGKKINDEYQISDVYIHKAVNEVSTARFEILDGDFMNGTFPISDSGFAPGDAVEILLGYHEKEKSVYKGIIVGHGLKIDPHFDVVPNRSKLVVTCADKAIKMTYGRKSAYFKKKKDSEIISSLISPSGASADVKATTVKHDMMVQFQSTDWDFMLARAEANGQIVLVDDGKVSVKPPAKAAAVLTITYGKDLYSFNAKVDARGQIPDMECVSWDHKTQKLVTGKSTEPAAFDGVGGSSTGKKLAKISGVSALKLKVPVPLVAGELKSWAKGKVTKSRLGRIKGTCSFQGSAKAKLGSIVEFKNMGSNFNGGGFVASLTHRASRGKWITEIGMGISENWFVEEEKQVSHMPAAGLLPAIHGLQTGTVKKIDADPDSAYRIQVNVPSIDNVGEGLWARMVHFYATGGAGSFFIPEVGDEVILGFLNNDPRFAVILGMVYNAKKKPAYEIDKKNPKKAIVSKEKIKIEFDDKDKILTLITPGENKIVFDDKAKGITLQDQHENKIVTSKDGIAIEDKNGNKITMASGGITIETGKDITIKGKNITEKASSSITMKATSSISAKANSGIKLEGMNIEAKAKINAKLEGVMVTTKASGIMTVKGSLVKIN
jgi:Rhs element Vgr protein